MNLHDIPRVAPRRAAREAPLGDWFEEYLRNPRFRQPWPAERVETVTLPEELPATPLLAALVEHVGRRVAQTVEEQLRAHPRYRVGPVRVVLGDYDDPLGRTLTWRVRLEPPLDDWMVR